MRFTQYSCFYHTYDYVFKQNSSAYLAEPPEISLQASTTAYDNISQTELHDTDSIDEMVCNLSMKICCRL